MGNLLCWSRRVEQPYHPAIHEVPVSVIDSHPSSSTSSSKPPSPFSPTHIRKDIYSLSPKSFQRTIESTNLPKCTQNQCLQMYARKRNTYGHYENLDALRSSRPLDQV